MYINSVEHMKTYLRRAGYEIIDQDRKYAEVRPYLIAWRRKDDAVVYIDFRIYESMPPRVPRLWYRNWLHRRRVKSAFNKWLRNNKWRGNRRFDVITVLPNEGWENHPVIDHITNVKM